MAAQQPVDPTETINAAAAAIAAGKPVDLVTLKAAAGWTTRLAGTDEDEHTLCLITLIGAQDYKSAILMLVNLSFEDDGAQTVAGNDDGLDDLIGGASAPTVKPTAASTPPPAPATAPAAAQTTVTPTPARSGRRAQRPANN